MQAVSSMALSRASQISGTGCRMFASVAEEMVAFARTNRMVSTEKIAGRYTSQLLQQWS